MNYDHLSVDEIFDTLNCPPIARHRKRLKGIFLEGREITIHLDILSGGRSVVRLEGDGRVLRDGYPPDPEPDIESAGFWNDNLDDEPVFDADDTPDDDFWADGGRAADDDDRPPPF